MKFIRYLILVFLLLTCFQGYSQPDTATTAKKTKTHTVPDGCARWYESMISVQAVAPIGDFSISHTIGFGAGYSYEQHEENGFLYFIANAGVTYYLGKNVKAIDYSYKYPGYTFIHLMAGYYILPGDLNIKLMAGPALGIYNGNTRFNIAGKFEVIYASGGKIEIGPVLNLMKEPKTNSIWSAGISATINLGVL